jgi:putative toxin-antitoxin system antitoxin component (TIGR02293 family)
MSISKSKEAKESLLKDGEKTEAEHIRIVNEWINAINDPEFESNPRKVMRLLTILNGTGKDSGLIEEAIARILEQPEQALLREQLFDAAKRLLLVVGKYISDNLSDPVKPKQEGVNVQQLMDLQQQLGLTVKETAELMNVSESTLLRRYKDPQAALSRHESDIFQHLMEVITEGLKVYEDVALLRHWLRLPLPALNGQIPTDLLPYIQGRNQLLDVFNQLKHGYTF